MWIFTAAGFISAVQHRDDHNLVMIRARKREHLEAFCESDPEPPKILETPDADYRYRTTMKRHWFSAMLVAHADCLDYDNYKNAITDPELARCAHDVWGDMLPLQRSAT